MTTPVSWIDSTLTSERGEGADPKPPASEHPEGVLIQSDYHGTDIYHSINGQWSWDSHHSNVAVRSPVFKWIIVKSENKQYRLAHIRAVVTPG